MEMKKRSIGEVRSYSDLLLVDAEVDRYSRVKGKFTVFPKTEYVVETPKQFHDMVKRISLVSSPYATVKGSYYLEEDS